MYMYKKAPYIRGLEFGSQSGLHIPFSFTGETCTTHINPGLLGDIVAEPLNPQSQLVSCTRYKPLVVGCQRLHRSFCIK